MFYFLHRENKKYWGFTNFINFQIIGAFKNRQTISIFKYKISGNIYYSTFIKNFPSSFLIKFKKIEDEPFYTQKEIDRTPHTGSSSTVYYTQNY